MKICRGPNSSHAYESGSSLRYGQNNHFSRPSRPLAPPWDFSLFIWVVFFEYQHYQLQEIKDVYLYNYPNTYMDARYKISRKDNPDYISFDCIHI